MAKYNYIQNLVKQYGDNWIVNFSSTDIQNRVAPRVFKDMVRGYINYETVGKYFLDSKLLENLIIACNNELEVNNLYAMSVEMFMQYYPQYPNISAHLNHLKCLVFIYNILNQKFQMVKETGNIGYFADISSILLGYKNHLN